MAELVESCGLKPVYCGYILGTSSAISFIKSARTLNRDASLLSGVHFHTLVFLLVPAHSFFGGFERRDSTFSREFQF